ncbi:MAG: phosphotransferase [Burkholderiaceae bacterium]
MTESDNSSPSQQARVAQMLSWLDGLDLPFQCQPQSLRAASSDASFRRYFRIATSRADTVILMDAPPPQENCQPFVHAARILADAGLRVPTVYASDLDNGFLLLSDLGCQTLLDELNRNPAHADQRYRQASAELVKLQKATRTGVFPSYNRERLTQELRLFDEWYVTRHKGFKLNTNDKHIVNKAYATIVDANLAQAQVYVHRDFHSRNLMTSEPDKIPGVLDFQDAVTGPISYDLVSLLRDAYISWPEEQVLDWTIRYWEAARETQLPVPEDFGEFWRDFEFMGLQRHLKVLGIFCRLNYRDGKSNYLADLPLVLSYTQAALARYESLQAFASLLQRIEGVDQHAGYTF